VRRGAEDALTTFEQNKDDIDLAIIDMIMPDMGGAALYDRIKAIDPTVNVIILSGYSLDDHAAHLMTRGCKAFLQKPLSVQTLSEKLREVLDNP